MQLNIPLFNFHNISRFSYNFQQNIKFFSNPFSNKFDKIKDLKILTLSSDNINKSLDVIRSNNYDINIYNNFQLSFENYKFEDIVKVYKTIINKMTEEVTSILYFFNINRNVDNISSFNRKLICDFLKETKPETDQRELIDIFIQEYLNIPKSINYIINFIYFIRRFPLIRFLINKYLYENERSTFNKIRQHELDNINYLLYIKEDIKPKFFSELHLSGLFNFDIKYHDNGYDVNLKNKVNADFTFSKIFNNTFLNNCNGCLNPEFKKYNAFMMIENKNKIENIIFLFPFLYTISSLFELKKITNNIITKILEKKNGIELSGEDVYINNVNKIIKMTFNTSAEGQRNFQRNGISFMSHTIDNDDPVLFRLFLLFSYDLLFNGIKTEMINNVSLEDLLIRLSMFIINLYGVYKRAELETIEDLLDVLQYDNNVIIDTDDEELDEDILRPVIPKDLPKNISYFYLFSANILFSNFQFKKIVEDDLYRASNMFYIFNVFNNDFKDLAPLFIFGAFSDGKNKYIKNYDYKKNFFLEWLIQYYDESFKDTELFVID